MRDNKKKFFNFEYCLGIIICPCILSFVCSLFLRIKFFLLQKWLLIPLGGALILGCIFLCKGYPGGSTAESNFVAAGSIFTVATLLYMAYAPRQDKISKSSEFYLTQVKEYFDKAGKLISYEDNNNVRWHQGIENLDAAINLSERITETAHKIIHLTDAMNVGYQLVNILGRIDNYRFFWGVPLYQDKSDAVLFEESDNFHKGLYTRISSTGLLMIMFFIIKISECKFLLSEGKSYKSIFDEYYITTSFASFFNSTLPEIEAVEQCLDKLQIYQKRLAEKRGYDFARPSAWKNFITIYVSSLIIQTRCIR